MSSSTLEPARCPATNRHGNPCGHQPGWGTGHPGYGYCKRHGGSTPNGIAHAAKARALAEMPAAGGEVSIDPLGAMEYTVRRVYGQSRWYRLQYELATMSGLDGEPWGTLERRALKDLNQMAKASSDAGVAERLARITEMQAERLSGAVEAMLAAITASGVEVPHAARMAGIRAFTGQIAALEAGGEIEAVATDVT